MENLEPIIAVIVDREKSTYDNINLLLVELQEGIITYGTRMEFMELAQGFIPFIDEDIYNFFIKNNTPLLYLMYDMNEEALRIINNELLETYEGYHRSSERILRLARDDFQ